jgi:hypothetical protein
MRTSHSSGSGEASVIFRLKFAKTHHISISSDDSLNVPPPITPSTTRFLSVNFCKPGMTGTITHRGQPATAFAGRAQRAGETRPREGENTFVNSSWQIFESRHGIAAIERRNDCLRRAIIRSPKQKTPRTGLKVPFRAFPVNVWPLVGFREQKTRVTRRAHPRSSPAVMLEGICQFPWRICNTCDSDSTLAPTSGHPTCHISVAKCRNSKP